MQLLLVVSLIVPCLIKSTLRASGGVQFNLGMADKENYLEHFYPSEGYSMVKVVNQLPTGAKIAVLDHHFIPYYYKDLGAFTWPIPAEIMALKSQKKIKEALRANGVTHVLLIPRRRGRLAPLLAQRSSDRVLFRARR